MREKGFWASLFGGEPEYEHDTAVYDRSLESGSTVVTVRATESHLTNIVDILDRHGPIDIDEHATSYGLGNTAGSGALSGRTAGSSGVAGTPTDRTVTGGMATGRTSTDTTAASPATQSGHSADLTRGGEEVIPLSEEQLKVGKRLVNRGTTRVRRFVVETPVEEAVTLHSETVSVDRRPVTDDRTAAAHDFSDRTIEVTETAEEAVVEKTARVKEEVVVNKAATDRVETVPTRFATKTSRSAAMAKPQSLPTRRNRLHQPSGQIFEIDQAGAPERSGGLRWCPAREVRRNQRRTSERLAGRWNWRVCAGPEIRLLWMNFWPGTLR